MVTTITSGNFLQATQSTAAQSVSTSQVTTNKTSSLMWHFFNLAPELKSKIFDLLNDRDLIAFQFSLGKGTSFERAHDVAFQKLQTLLDQQREFATILTQNPKWAVSAHSWKNVSLANKIWLLRIYELYHWTVHRIFDAETPPSLKGLVKNWTKCEEGLPQIAPLYSSSSNKEEHLPCERSLELLEPKRKKEVETCLDEITSFNGQTSFQGWDESNIPKSFSALRLLPNLNWFHIEKRLRVPPDFTANVKMVDLMISRNLFRTPPNVRHFPHLKQLTLASNLLTTAPDLTQNVALTYLDLSDNQLTEAPNVSLNILLKSLMLSANKITIPPDLRQNVALETLNMDHNQLTHLPDLTRCPRLSWLLLNDNRLNSALDLRNNRKLMWIQLQHNQIPTIENVHSLVALRELHAQNNRFTVAPDVHGNSLLRCLDLSNNRITLPPDVSQCPALMRLFLSNNLLNTNPNVTQNPKLDKLALDGNRLTTAPGVASNLKLELLKMENNPLTKKARKKLRALKKDQPELKLSFDAEVGKADKNTANEKTS